MIGQSKSVYQAEIDAACELIDFLRFNVQYMREIYTCLLYTSDAADERSSVDLGGRRIIKKKKKKKY